MFLNEEFEVEKLPKSTSNFDPLPPGWYGASITEAELKKLKMVPGNTLRCGIRLPGRHIKGVSFSGLSTPETRA